MKFILIFDLTPGVKMNYAHAASNQADWGIYAKSTDSLLATCIAS
jgi:hypothetical protein